MPEITLIGYGNQGKAWAANLRDSGWKVFVSGRPNGLGMRAASQDGFATIAPSELRKQGGILALLLPDEKIPVFFREYLSDPNPSQTRCFVFAHGFSVVYGKLPFAKADEVILVAPKGIGTKLRQKYTEGSGVMAVLAVAQGNAWDKCDLIAEGLGSTRVGVLKSTFRDETVTDLLSEQAILCGPVPALVDQAVRFLVEKGIDPKLATYECLHELKLIVDMMVEHGVEGMYRRVSRTAHFGGLLANERLASEAKIRPELEGIWDEIVSGRFAEALSREEANDYAVTKKHFTKLSDSPVDKNL